MAIYMGDNIKKGKKIINWMIIKTWPHNYICCPKYPIQRDPYEPLKFECLFCAI